MGPRDTGLRQRSEERPITVRVRMLDSVKFDSELLPNEHVAFSSGSLVSRRPADKPQRYKRRMGIGISQCHKTMVCLVPARELRTLALARDSICSPIL